MEINGCLLLALNIGPSESGQSLEDQNQQYRQDYKLGKDLKYEHTRIIVLKIRRQRYNIE